MRDRQRQRKKERVRDGHRERERGGGGGGGGGGGCTEVTYHINIFCPLIFFLLCVFFGKKR